MTPYDLRAFFALQREARQPDRRAWEPLERMRVDETPDLYAENPPHGCKGHRVSRNCDQCVENGS